MKGRRDEGTKGRREGNSRPEEESDVRTGYTM